ncbi:NUDIX domain-containing protein [Agreia bicolorata]|uniref:NUDIX domain-containing protein n=1 Tax=Agreia bicolorata TaxID=110935 RepID=UPI000999B608|nr:NUDIX domain-containing protein [Agreia bicolorata]
MNLTERLAREAVLDGIERFVSGAVVHSNGRVLLVRRSDDDEYLPGREELPSGGVDDGESIDEGRTRELQEEIGLGEHRVDVTAETREVLVQWWTWHMGTALSGVV